MLVTCNTDVEVPVDGTLMAFKAGEAFDMPDEEAQAKIDAGLLKAATKTAAKAAGDNPPVASPNVAATPPSTGVNK